jgi:hypothetical protein
MKSRHPGSDPARQNPLAYPSSLVETSGPGRAVVPGTPPPPNRKTAGSGSDGEDAAIDASLDQAHDFFGDGPLPHGPTGDGRTIGFSWPVMSSELNTGGGRSWVTLSRRSAQSRW